MCGLTADSWEHRPLACAPKTILRDYRLLGPETVCPSWVAASNYWCQVSQMKTLLRHVWREWLRPALFCAVVVFPFKSVIADWNYVPTGSMKPTILEGDFVFINKLAYDLKVPFTTRHLATWNDPQRGEIVVFYSPQDGMRLVKRVVGLPGDTVELRNERLYVNGSAISYSSLDANVSADLTLEEKNHAIFAQEQLGDRAHAVMALPECAALRTFQPVHVPVGSYFVMGDNRDNSNDSRFWGFVPRSQILGEAKAIVISADLAHYAQPRLARFFSGLK